MDQSSKNSARIEDETRHDRIHTHIYLFLSFFLLVFFKEEKQFRMQRTEYPLLDIIKTAVDPYYRLFTTVRKWQVANKKWMHGSFLDLNSEKVEGEVDEYCREMLKIKKQFTNLVKKKKLDLANRVMEKRKARGKSIECNAHQANTHETHVGQYTNHIFH
jgi:hypothetical protein